MGRARACFRARFRAISRGQGGYLLASRILFLSSRGAYLYLSRRAHLCRLFLAAPSSRARCARRRAPLRRMLIPLHAHLTLLSSPLFSLRVRIAQTLSLARINACCHCARAHVCALCAHMPYLCRATSPAFFAGWRAACASRAYAALHLLSATPASS